MPGSAEQVVSEVGKRLAQPRLGKDALVKLLKVTAPRPVPSRPRPVFIGSKPSSFRFS
jgi:hypothetical protein